MSVLLLFSFLFAAVSIHASNVRGDKDVSKEDAQIDFDDAWETPPEAGVQTEAEKVLAASITNSNQKSETKHDPGETQAEKKEEKAEAANKSTEGIGVSSLGNDISSAQANLKNNFDGAEKKEAESKEKVTEEEEETDEAAAEQGSAKPVSAKEVVLRSEALASFLALFMLVVGVAKVLTTNIVRNVGKDLVPVLVLMYSETAVLCLVGMIGFIVLRMNILPNYVATLLPGEKHVIVVKMFEDTEIAVLSFAISYVCLAIAVLSHSVNISIKWKYFEHQLPRIISATDKAGKARKASARHGLKVLIRAKRLLAKIRCCGPKRRILDTQKAFQYAQMREDFIRNSLSRRTGLSSGVFDFAAYLTSRLGITAASAVTIPISAWMFLLISVCLVSLIMRTGSLSQAWSLFIFGVVIQVFSIVMTKSFANAARGVRRPLPIDVADGGGGSVAESGRSTEMSSSPLLKHGNVANTFSPVLMKSFTKTKSNVTCCRARTRQHALLCCGTRGITAEPTMIRCVVISTSMYCALAIQVGVHVLPEVFRGQSALVFLAYSAAICMTPLVVISNLGSMLKDHTFATNVEILRKPAILDELVSEAHLRLSRDTYCFAVDMLCLTLTADPLRLDDIDLSATDEEMRSYGFDDHELIERCIESVCKDRGLGMSPLALKDVLNFLDIEISTAQASQLQRILQRGGGRERWV